ncbi:type IV pilus modification PilV family protein [Rubrobacter indicoceani]|uniref:type IV pilus modification PilV family protein n=1 Tax=Rubrobacter indicoceani TaxID=2051957 RepID=UPI0013C4C64D|nr:prepilin-type N-terminal cleavage/methylation domain-containing protein [Rubrobacter indicoceani]
MRGGGCEAGYSLLEVMVAVVILTVCIIPMAGMFDAAVGAGGGDLDRARSQANRTVETVRALDYRTAVLRYGSGGAVACPGGEEPGYEGSSCTLRAGFVDEELRLTDVRYGTRLLLEVRVEWDGKTHRQTALVAAVEP